ncbi:alpha/beta hydrolase [Tamaricihabitans halophyticus]|nr:alpha/beta hydrolase [Tamaricihabitans halophyticus]
MTEHPVRPALHTWPTPPDAPSQVVVLVLHGGRAHDESPVRAGQLAYERMRWFARSLRSTVTEAPVSIAVLRNRMRGWNEQRLDAVADANWALGEITRTHPRGRVLLVGHSMGGRVALRLGDAPQVCGIAALAPWLEDDEPVAHLADRSVLIAHGTRDTVTSPLRSAAYVRRATGHSASAEYVAIDRSGHGMLQRRAAWNLVVREFLDRFFDKENDRDS